MLIALMIVLAVASPLALFFLRNRKGLKSNPKTPAPVTPTPAPATGTPPAKGATSAPPSWWEKTKDTCSKNKVAVASVIAFALGMMFLHHGWPNFFWVLVTSWTFWAVIITFLLFTPLTANIKHGVVKGFRAFLVFCVVACFLGEAPEKLHELRCIAEDQPRQCVLKNDLGEKAKQMAVGVFGTSSQRFRQPDTTSRFVTLTKSAPATEVVVPLGYYYDVQSYDTTVKIKVDRSTRGSDLVNTYTMSATADSVRLLVLLIH